MDHASLAPSAEEALPFTTVPYSFAAALAPASTGLVEEMTWDGGRRERGGGALLGS